MNVPLSLANKAEYNQIIIGAGDQRRSKRVVISPPAASYITTHVHSLPGLRCRSFVEISWKSRTL